MHTNLNFCHFSIGGQQNPWDIYSVPNRDILDRVIHTTIGMPNEIDSAVPAGSLGIGGGGMDNNWMQYDGPAGFPIDETSYENKE